MEIALANRTATRASRANNPTYLEELIVRRELAINQVFYGDGYDSYETSLPDNEEDTRQVCWRRAPAPLFGEQSHRRQDARYILERCHARIVQDCYMYSQLRMYWGKEILH